MSTQCVNFTGREDGIVEPNENFTVNLTPRPGDDVVLDPSTAVVTIVEGVGKLKRVHSMFNFSLEIV